MNRNNILKNNKVINVMYRDQIVGRLALTSDNLCAFEYDRRWLVNGFSISPFKLPLEKKVFIASREPFGGNFGVFDDSLPDGWGRLLIDRMLLKMRINPAEVSVLDRLAILGKTGMGALEYVPEYKLCNSKITSTLSELEKECEKILNEIYDGDIEQLFSAGGSSGGARPKILIKINNDDWIIKFRSSFDPKNVGQIEYRYSQIAKQVGIEMPETHLFENKYFGVKRFDRLKNGKKVHMISASALLDASHRFPCLDYSDLIKATHMLTRDMREVEKMFRLMCFNVFMHNRDDHSKNFSFIYSDGRWKVSPAYDLVFSKGIMGEHATTVAGEGKNPTKEHILSVASEVGIDNKRGLKIVQEIEHQSCIREKQSKSFSNPSPE